MRQRVLIIDDEPGIRHLCARVLGQRHDVLEADGIMAAQRYVEQGVDLIVLDIMMPGISGVDGIGVIRGWARDPVHLPILMLTALNDTDARIEALSAGADDFITKPFHATELRLRVENFLRTRAQDQVIRQQRDELHESLSLRDELLAMVVHDLRNPLTSVLAAFEFLKAEALSELASRDVADGLAAARRVSAVTDDILRLLAADGGLPQHRQRMHLRPLIDRATAALASAARSHDVRIEVCGDAELEVDPDLILRAVENLVGNAIRYAPAGSPIDVSISDNDDDVVIRVDDRGPGVPEELRSAIFSKSVHRGRPGHRSYGLGLYLVDVVARAHGGRVGVGPRDGGGSSFFVRLLRPHERTVSSA